LTQGPLQISRAEEEPEGRGGATDRNVLLVVPVPFEFR
jgi:hypothetical protein